MDDLKKAFRQAQKDVMSLSRRPSNDELLKLYALYKQGSSGDATGARPGMLDFKGRAKYDAWAKLRGTSKTQAMQDYVACVAELRAAEPR